LDIQHKSITTGEQIDTQKTINTPMKIEIDFDMGYETNIPWIEAI